MARWTAGGRRTLSKLLVPLLIALPVAFLVARRFARPVHQILSRLIPET